MPIIDHPTVKIQVNTPWVYEPAKVVECDFCHGQAGKAGHDIGTAAEQARAVGFSTVRTGLGAPMKWWCGKCARSG